MPEKIDVTLKNCFKPGKGKPNLTKTSINAENVEKHI